MLLENGGHVGQKSYVIEAHLFSSPNSSDASEKLCDRGEFLSDKYHSENESSKGESGLKIPPHYNGREQGTSGIIHPVVGTDRR